MQIELHALGHDLPGLALVELDHHWTWFLNLGIIVFFFFFFGFLALLFQIHSPPYILDLYPATSKVRASSKSNRGNFSPVLSHQDEGDETLLTPRELDF